MHTKMKQDFFKYLPSEIITEILSILPLKTIAVSKCVCKSWLDLLESDYFVNSHLSKSVPTLAVLLPDGDSNRCTVFEFVDGDEFDFVESSHHHRRYNPLTKFDFPHSATIEGSANGLLLLYKLGSYADVLYICNPITRCYVELCCPEDFVSCAESQAAFLFGASKISNQLKVVRISPKSECHVYTLGTGLWRRLRVEEARASLLLKYEDFIFSTCVDGHLYWEVSESSTLITCFDLETESLSSFCAPASPGGGLSVLGDRLCFCEWEDEIVIWLMTECGGEKSWRKEYVISQGLYCDGYYYNSVYPIKVFKNGDMLMFWDGEFLFYYSNEKKTVREIVDNSMFDEKHDCTNFMPLTPSFLSLEGLGMENVISF